jgi:homoserine dehydrogenase
MKHYDLALLGFGNVGQALARLLERKQEDIKKGYDLTYAITAIATSRHGAAINPHGLDIQRALELVKSGRSLSELSSRPAPAEAQRHSWREFIRQCGADVLFENTPVNYETGQPALDHLRLALENGMHAITANKGPVVHGYRELTALAHSKGRCFYFESTVMDGAPLSRCSAGAARLPGCPACAACSTPPPTWSSRMEKGESFEDAVRYAQSIGIAETDPSGDIDG